MGIAQSYERSPNKWNLSIVLSLGAILWAGLMMSIQIHSGSETAHPVIVGKLDRIETNQVREQILAMDERICKEPDNKYYRDEILKLITEWEKLSRQEFPVRLLRCANGRA